MVDVQSHVGAMRCRAGVAGGYVKLFAEWTLGHFPSQGAFATAGTQQEDFEHQGRIWCKNGQILPKRPNSAVDLINPVELVAGPFDAAAYRFGLGQGNGLTGRQLNHGFIQVVLGNLALLVFKFVIDGTGVHQAHVFVKEKNMGGG
jgi:hypothetical protein